MTTIIITIDKLKYPEKQVELNEFQQISFERELNNLGTSGFKNEWRRRIRQQMLENGLIKNITDIPFWSIKIELK